MWEYQNRNFVAVHDKDVNRAGESKAGIICLYAKVLQYYKLCHIFCQTPSAVWALFYDLLKTESARISQTHFLEQHCTDA